MFYDNDGTGTLFRMCNATATVERGSRSQDPTVLYKEGT